MAERLIIQNFAGLNLEIELGRINIFIGSQASGKSVCIKCIAYMQSFADMLINYAGQGSTKQEFDTAFIEYFSSLFATTDSDFQFSIRYSIDNFFIELRSKKQKISLSYSAYYGNLFSQIKNIHEDSLTPTSLGPETSIYKLAEHIIEEARYHLGIFLVSNRLFVPTNRTHFSLLQQTGRPPLSIISDDPMSSWFQNFYHYLRKQQSKRRHKDFPFRNSNKIASELISQILRATLTKEDKKDVLIHQNGIRTSLRQASSGQQESLPLLLVLEYLIGASPRDLSSVIFVEEPETHLHPEAQRNLVNLIAAVYNISSKPLQFFITTHTPYLLSSFNNLIYAGQLASNLKKNDSVGRKKLYTTVSKELHLNSVDFRVYGLENGEAHLLIDEETGLLRADTLDSVSDVIADQFGALMDLDPTTKSSVSRK